MSVETYVRLKCWLDEHKIRYQEVEHSAAKTSLEAAAFRATELGIGCKSLLLKDKFNFKLFTISANKTASNKLIRKILKSDKLRFATDEELMENCQVVSGALPPFGKPFYSIDQFIDVSVLRLKKVAFTAGRLDRSLILEIDEYLKLINPKICRFHDA